MGICFTAEDDEKLARGWPHLIVPVDGGKDKTSAAAENAWMKSDPIFFTEWPRKTLHRFLNWLMTPWEKWNDAAAKAALARTEAPSAELCLEGLRRRVREGATHPFAYRNLVWGVEAIVGTDVTLESIVADMESTYPTIPESADACEAVVSAASFLLLRASPGVAKTARARMEHVFDAQRDAKTAEAFEGYFDTLDFALHGVAGVKNFFAKWPKWTVWLEVPALYCAGSLDYADDPAFVRDVITKTDPKLLSAGMSVRVAAMGGPAALALLSKRKWPAVQMPSVVRDLGMIRAPEIVTFIASLVGKSAAKDAPITWLRAHADYARPILAKEKTGAAKLALKQLG